MRKSLLVLWLLAITLACGRADDRGTVSPVADAKAAPGTWSEHKDYSWGYCHSQTQQTLRTFIGWSEVGVKKNGGPIRCQLPFPSGAADVIAIHGTFNYYPWADNKLSSMLVAIMADDGSEYLATTKIATKGRDTTVPFSVTFPKPIHANRFTLMIFDDEAKPTTISVGITAVFQ